ncbi:hypothetical protein EJ02DRAFT_314059, partial [Clathrospora elynae]
STRSPKNPSNRLWIQEQQRRVFLRQLRQWSLGYDSSPYFQGKIGLLPPDPRSREEIGLGKSVSCILTDTTFTDARKRIVVRLFPPHTGTMDEVPRSKRRERHDYMDPFDTRLRSHGYHRDASSIEGFEFYQPSQSTSNPPNSYYKLVIRIGSGWLSARDYLSKLYFTHLLARKPSLRNPYLHTVDRIFTTRSQLLGPPPSPKDSVTIQPLFHPFLRLPPELQEMILRTASGLIKNYNLCADPHLYAQPKPSPDQQVPISLSTMFQISHAISRTMVPYTYRATTFHFSLTGFTNFLWQSGPGNRVEIRRLTFHYGRLALLHCLRWFAPDPVFDLLQPPVLTNPRALQYFWRCQIRDLAREVNLRCLTIDVKGVPSEDVNMVVRILKNAFGSVEHVRFVETNDDGSAQTVMGIQSEGLGEKNWRELCTRYFERHRLHQYFSRADLMRVSTGEFQRLMDGDMAFFD